jgi:hypothetical protein
VEATVRNNSHTLTRTASAVMTPGTVVQEAGMGGVIMGAGLIPIGENYEVALDVIADVACATGTTFSEGDEVQWDNTGKLAVASGDFSIGRANRAKVSGELIVSVIFNQGASLATIARSGITQQDLVPYTIPLTSLRVHDAMATALPATAANDDMGLITGTPGTDSPTVQGVDFGGTTSDEKSAFEFVLPAEYVAGETITARVRAAMLTTVSDGTATVDVECWVAGVDGAAGSDICATAATTINSLTPGNKDFTITPTSRAPGDRLIVRLSFAGSDTGDLGVMIPEITLVQMLLDIKG